MNLYSLFTHKGRVHVKFPISWVIDADPLYAYTHSNQGAIAFVYFPSVGYAFRLFEIWTPGVGQPIPVVESIDHSQIQWSDKPHSIFEPINKVRIFGGSNQPIFLEHIVSQSTP